MTDNTALYNEWQENKDRPAWIQRNRERLAEATGMWIPERRSVIAGWLPDHKSPITTKLKEEAGDDTSSTEDD